MTMRLLTFALLCCCGTAAAQHPLQLCRENPHYFQFRNRPVLLISSGGRYGVLSRPDRDYIPYFDSLAAYGMNVTRVFSGANIWLHEEDKASQKTGMVNILTPWARSRTPGYIGGGNKFDLDQWDDQYFARLKQMIAEAGRRGIFIELTLFGNNYDDSVWRNSPLYPANNAQGIGPSGPGSFRLFQTGADKRMTERQDSMVTKMVRELNGYDNLYYEICNEPNNELKDTVGMNAWVLQIAALIRQTESSLPKKHLIASNEAMVDDSAISVANFHYLRVSNMPDFDWLYHLNKVISMDETLILPHQEDINDMRVEAWDFLLRGGGVYNNLSYPFPHSRDSLGIARAQLRCLKTFLSAFRFTRMSPDKTAVDLKSKEATVRVLSEKGKQYAIYLHHSRLKQGAAIWGYDAIVQNFRDTLALDIPSGNYWLKWVIPSSDLTLGEAKKIHSTGRPIELLTPLFKTDIAAVVLKAK